MSKTLFDCIVAGSHSRKLQLSISLISAGTASLSNPLCWILPCCDSKIQWKLLNRASVYRANRLFKQFRLKNTILSFSSYKFFAYESRQEHHLLEQLDV